MGSLDWFEIIRDFFLKGNSPIISIDHNKRTTIKNVNIAFNINSNRIYLPNNYEHGYRNSLQEMISDDILLKSAMEKQVYLIDRLEEFRAITYREKIQPTIRMKALFSPFSTIRQESDTDDLSRLELEEKSILMDLAEYGCIFKIIMNLDFTRAVACGYDLEEISRRVGDLCITCDALSGNGNFQAVICMEAGNYEPIWTFDEVLIEKQMLFCGKSNYSTCFWSSNINEIRDFNMKFDREFQIHYQEMYQIWKVLRINSLSEYIMYCLGEWGKQIINI